LTEQRSNFSTSSLNIDSIDAPSCDFPRFDDDSDLDSALADVADEPEARWQHILPDITESLGNMEVVLMLNG
jgi:hypothetical protein